MASRRTTKPVKSEETEDIDTGILDEPDTSPSNRRPSNPRSRPPRPCPEPSRTWRRPCRDLRHRARREARARHPQHRHRHEDRRTVSGGGVSMPDEEAPFAEVSDLEARWRGLDTRRTGTGRNAAGRRVRQDPRRLSAPMEEGFGTDPDPHRLPDGQTRHAGRRHGRRPIRPQTTGPFSDTVAYSNPDGDLYLTASERQSLGADRRHAFTIRMTGGDGA